MASDTERRNAAAPTLLVIQTNDESIHIEAARLGWTVVHHTNNPLPWLEDLNNILSVNAVVVTPLALSVEAIAADVEVIMEYFNALYLYVDSDHWLELTRE